MSHLETPEHLSTWIHLWDGTGLRGSHSDSGDTRVIHPALVCVCVFLNPSRCLSAAPHRTRDRKYSPTSPADVTYKSSLLGNVTYFG